MKTDCRSSFKKYELYEYNQRNNVIKNEMYTHKKKECDSDILIPSQNWDSDEQNYSK